MFSEREIKDFFNEHSVNRNTRTAQDRIFQYEQQARSRMVISMLDPMPKESILDIGCGNGRDLIPLSPKECVCKGIDSSSGMIEEAQKQIENRRIQGIEINVGDATNLNFSDQMFDKVFSSEVLEHIPDYHKAISEMARVLKNSGTLVITAPNKHSMYGFDRYVIYQKILGKKWSHPYDSWKTFGELAISLSENGLRIVNVSGI